MKTTILILAVLFSCFLYSENANILVTGGAGYIGSHTCKALREKGFNPIVYDSLINGSEEAVKWGPFIKGDLLDSKKLEEAFQRYHPVAVIHFAALTNIFDSTLDPDSYYRTNIVGSLNILHCMKKYDVKKIIFSSSCAVYGEKNFSQICEKEKKEPINPYGFSKHVVEQMIQDFANAYGLDYVILRYFNAAGIDHEAGLIRAGNLRNFLIPKAIEIALNPKIKLPIFGTQFNTPDGTAIRDYIHVMDIARAHQLALNYLLAKKTSYCLNLGTGKGYSVNEVIHMIESCVGKSLPVENKPAREGELTKMVADPALSRKILRFEPIYSDLKTIVESELMAQKKDLGIHNTKERVE
ncbi:MAG: UDP-glucose 4-epimerase [Chlamydiae bacterium]|nr:UDP-glucose 4-epimerase [Chlamydiota bacterium]